MVNKENFEKYKSKLSKSNVDLINTYLKYESENSTLSLRIHSSFPIATYFFVPEAKHCVDNIDASYAELKKYGAIKDYTKACRELTNPDKTITFIIDFIVKK